jgi:hypothetical protein
VNSSVGTPGTGRRGLSESPSKGTTFRTTDEQGHKRRSYSIIPNDGMVAVTPVTVSTKAGQPLQPKNVSEEVGIQRRDDLMVENVKYLILRAIEEYRNDSRDIRCADTNNHLK